MTTRCTCNRTGAAVAVGSAVIRGERPRRSSESNVQRHALFDAGQQRLTLRQCGQVRATTTASWLAWPKVNSRKKIPTVEGDYTIKHPPACRRRAAR